MLWNVELFTNYGDSSSEVGEDMSDAKLSAILLPSVSAKPNFKMSDYVYVSREMQKSGVTLNLLWLEYCESCQISQETPYQLTQYKKYYRDHVRKTNAAMHLNHKLGEILQADWAGNTKPLKKSDLKHRATNKLTNCIKFRCDSLNKHKIFC